MGVKDLWNILSPSCERKPLFELQGKTVAIDLSCWIVDSQTIVDNATQPKMYLRNLFFRTANLLMQETFPIFVLEGKAPNLKHKEMERRNKLRERDGEKKRTTRKGGRNRLNNILKECEQMLSLMGLKCVKGHGEAEAMCAYLNEDGLVDACVSQDSDCFLYGARTVYRNFCTSVQGNRGGTGGSVDEYTMEKIERLFKLDRSKMIALALLCGCDYDDGVNGIGKEAVLKLFKILEGENVLERLKSWRTHSKFKRMESQLNDPNLCTSCGHAGKVRTHAKSGCGSCGTVTSCDDSYKEVKSSMKHELNLRDKALSVDGFPSQELIDEFLVRKGPMPSSVDIQWRQPRIVEFVNFMCHHVCWEPEYAFAKIFSLATRWQLRHFADVPPENRVLMHGVMIPERIKKIRRIKCVESYEIVWIDKDDILEGLMLGKNSDDDDADDDDDDNDNEKSPNELVSVEPQSAIRRCYPELAEQFENARLAKKKKPAKKRERKKKPEGTVEKENELPETIGGGKKTAPKRTRKKVDATKNNRKMDEFVETAATAATSLEDSFGAMTIAPKKTKTTVPAELGKPRASGTPKRGPQFDRLLSTAGISSALDGTLGRMFDELTPDDFASEMEDESFIMREVVERVCSGRSTRSNVAGNISPVPRIDDNPKFEIPTNKTEKTVLNEDREPEVHSVHGDSEEFDEFAEFDVTYVPISQRLKLPNSPKFDRRRIDEIDRNSLGVGNLMDDSD